MHNFLPNDFLTDMTAEGKHIDLLNSTVEGYNSRGKFNGSASDFLGSLGFTSEFDIVPLISDFMDHGKASTSRASAELVSVVFRDDAEVCILHLEQDCHVIMTHDEFEAELAAHRKLIEEAKKRAARR